MARLAWSQAGNRYFETGVDRGVLYLPDYPPLAWNGLSSVEEDFGEDTTSSYFLDGVKFLDVPQAADFAATLKAYTYPEEFQIFEGVSPMGNGLYADEQPQASFGLTYRTLVGNDLDEGLGYKLHICYNLVAIPQDVSHETTSDKTTAIEFAWKLSAVPSEAPGYRPTAHVILDSRYIYPRLLQQLEDTLYGTDTTDGHLPPITELIPLVTNWRLIYVYDNGDGTWTAYGPDDLVYYDANDSTKFYIEQADATYIDANTFTLRDSLEPKG